MIEPTATNQIQDPANGWAPPCHIFGDRELLLSLLRRMLECLDRIGLGDPLALPPDARLDRWEDEDYVYLQARVAGDAPESVIDLNAADGQVFVRISRQPEPHS